MCSSDLTGRRNGVRARCIPTASDGAAPSCAGNALHGNPVIAPSPVACKTMNEVPKAMTTAEVEAMTKKFIKAAVIAKTAGFDGVEIHGAYGYLVNQFLSPYTNRRRILADRIDAAKLASLGMGICGAGLWLLQEGRQIGRASCRERV